ncbi:MAG: bifunctional 4'-phosphopantothenoylcysteine decarboxylase/phosphopantothenoylcysteine synthetase, partial [Anaerolineae bacterium]|nr:bifunctional 4'-phosphopantothenoylcysteine decarboxylase/phosphopantothenoylcysteine synthetase [Anaerolineae bacterium]
AHDKLQRKGLDLLVANDIRAADAGFAVDTNRVTVLSAQGDPQPLDLMSKAQVSEQLIARVAALLGKAGG